MSEVLLENILIWMDSGCVSDLQFVDLEWKLLLVKIFKYNAFERHSNETKLTINFHD